MFSALHDKTHNSCDTVSLNPLAISQILWPQNTVLPTQSNKKICEKYLRHVALMKKHTGCAGKIPKEAF